MNRYMTKVMRINKGGGYDSLGSREPQDVPVPSFFIGHKLSNKLNYNYNYNYIIYLSNI